MTEWKEYKLGDLIKDIAAGPFGSNLKVECFVESGFPIIDGANLKGFKVTDNITKFVTEEKARSLHRSIAKRNDVIVTISDNVGQIAYIPNDSKFIEYLVSQRQFRVSFDESAIDVPYLVYYFHTREGQHKILSFANQVGVPALAQPLKNFKAIELNLPSLPTQRRIASILSSLDDKIDLLHRENKTLEAMAETLFRQWFIEEAKEDWKEGKLGDIISVKGGTTPSTREPHFWNGDIAWTSPRDVTTLNGLYLFETEKKITQKGLEQISSGLLPVGTLLMSSRAPVGVLAFSEIPITINQGYIAILDDKGYEKEFIYLWLKANMDTIHSYSNGSTFMEISKSAFKSIDIVIPTKEEVNVFVDRVKPIFEKIKANVLQIQTLIQKRDILLPKLMSN